MGEPLHIVYRPDSFDGVIGQDETIAALENVIKRKNAHAFVFHGPSGVGKTTLARICSDMLGATKLEIDGATYNGIDDMRRIQDVLQYRSFGKTGVRAIIVDEAHRLSGQAWDSLLKAVEEPPDHIYWFFATTNPAKLPNTIRTRCVTFELRSVSERELGDFFDGVCENESIKLSEDVGALIIREARGSVRQMLVNLETARDAKTSKEAARLLKTATATDPVLELCRLLIAGRGSWPKVTSIIKKMDGENAEGVRIVVLNYMKSALMKATTDKDVQHLLWVMQQFDTSFYGATEDAQLLQAIGRVLYAEG